MSKKGKKEIPEGTITVTVPFVKRRDFSDNVKYEGRGNRVYRVPLDVFHDKLKEVLQHCPYEDKITSEETYYVKTVKNNSNKNTYSTTPRDFFSKDVSSTHGSLYDLIMSFFD